VPPRRESRHCPQSGIKNRNSQIRLAPGGFSVYEPAVLLNILLGLLALLSLVLMLWQWNVARRFPLHQRPASAPFAPGVTLLKPLKGCDSTTGECLRSWLTQQYAGPIQILFGVASPEDPVCAIVQSLKAEFPKLDIQLVVGGSLDGTNLKVCKLQQLEKLAAHEVIVVSDADVRVPPDFLANVVAPLEQPGTGLVNCFYILANPATLAMRWEAVAINADFWSQVLQSLSLKPMDFALGAVMATRRKNLAEIGGFASLTDCLADDYQLGHRIALKGHRIALSPVVVECRSESMGWSEVWKHQLRWARTIRVCQPLPYFFSILSNPTLWPLLWLVCCPSRYSLAFVILCAALRVITALNLQTRLTRLPQPWSAGQMALAKDLLQFALWLMAFAGNHVEWRGARMRLRPDGTLVKAV
jgi:ceramide glucosyltransferase